MTIEASEEEDDEEEDKEEALETADIKQIKTSWPAQIVIISY